MSTDDNKKLDVRITDPERKGYGTTGSMTRGEWQAECMEKLLSGPEVFNQWQQDLATLEANKPDVNDAIFDFKIIHHSDHHKADAIMGWSDTPCKFVVDVVGLVFEQELLDFSRYSFMTGALFSGSKFKGVVVFNQSSFHRDAYFHGAEFKTCLMSNAVFLRGAIFDNAIFGNNNDFHSSAYNVSFACLDTKFKAVSSFKFATFNASANFERTEFSYAAFDESIFKKDVTFSGRTVNNNNNLYAFGPVSFRGAKFEGRADFSNRIFTGNADFGRSGEIPTKFFVAPLFHNSILHQSTSFMTVVFPETSDNDELAPRAYNTLRHAMHEQQATREERRFMILELDAERSNSGVFERLLYTAYKKFSNYGFSVIRPLWMLVVLPFVIAGLCYGLIVTWEHCGTMDCLGGVIDPHLTAKTAEFALIQSLPPIGLGKIADSLRSSLFPNGSHIYGLIAYPVLMLQRILALIGWFFVALALRNKFKLI